MEKTLLEPKQVQKHQDHTHYTYNQLPFAEKVNLLRQKICQIITRPQDIQSQHWKSLQLRVANLMGRDPRVDSFIKLLKHAQPQGTKTWLKGNSNSQSQKGQLQDQAVCYLLEPILMLKVSRTEKLWKYRELYFASQQLLAQVNRSEQPEILENRAILVQVLSMNKVVCCLQLEIYQKALQQLDALIKRNLGSSKQLEWELQFVRKTILMRMGCRVRLQLSELQTESQMMSQGQPSDKVKDRQLCLRIISFDSQSLKSFIFRLRNQQIRMSLQNLYNLGLVCKRFQFWATAEAILKRLIDLQPEKCPASLRLKCYALLSEIEQERGNLWAAVEALKQIKVDNPVDITQCEFRKQRLYKKIKIQAASKACAKIPAKATIKYNLLCGLENELGKLRGARQQTQLISNKNASALYQLMTRRKTVKKIIVVPQFEAKPPLLPSALNHPLPQIYSNTLLPQCTSINPFTTESQLSTMKSTNQLSVKVNNESMLSTQMQTKQEIQKEEEAKSMEIPSLKQTTQPQIADPLAAENQVEDKPTLTKLPQPGEYAQPSGQQDQPSGQQYQPYGMKQTKREVRFRMEQPRAKIQQMIVKADEKISALFANQQYHQIAPLITSILHQLFQHEHTPSIETFVLKCVSWYRILGYNNQAICLLKLNIGDSKLSRESLPFQIYCLKCLGEVYQDLKDARNAAAVYLQLAKLGEVEYYQKLGELSLLTQRYAEAVKHFEIYDQLKRNLHSKSKLAHAYSKMGIYMVKAIEMMNEILFTNKNLLMFREFEVEQAEDVQNVVLLLVSIYMQHQSGCEKAKNICEKYLQLNFSSYPVFYLLGIIYEQEGRKEEAFQNYLTALKLNPNHLPSLIRIVSDIGVGNTNNFEITNILRKAFVQNNRNWQLLQLLVQSITLTKQEQVPVSVEQVVRCAKILQKAEFKSRDMNLQIEMVWIWAFELLEERRRKEQAIEEQYENEINMRLGEINMAKGNLKASEFYLKKVLARLQLRRKRTERRRGIIKCELQAMQRLSYIKARQNQSVEGKGFKMTSSVTYKQNRIENGREMERRLNALSPKLFGIDINKI